MRRLQRSVTGSLSSSTISTDREGETDFAIRSDAVTPKDIVRMRKDGGGLICTAVHPIAAQRLGLPFASDALQGNCGCGTGRRYPVRPEEPLLLLALGEPPEHVHRYHRS